MLVYPVDYITKSRKNTLIETSLILSQQNSLPDHALMLSRGSWWSPEDQPLAAANRSFQRREMSASNRSFYAL